MPGGDKLGPLDALPGVFFWDHGRCPVQISAADCAWAPFLERYAAQLPLLHSGLRPYDARLRELAG